MKASNQSLIVYKRQTCLKNVRQYFILKKILERTTISEELFYSNITYYNFPEAY